MSCKCSVRIMGDPDSEEKRENQRGQGRMMLRMSKLTAHTEG
jgi:hypothetical protein